MDCSMPVFPVLHHLPELVQIHIHWVGDAIQPSHYLLSPSPTFNLSQRPGLFQWVGSSHEWPKYWSFSFGISPSSEYSGLIFLRINWFDLLAVQGILKRLLQHHSLKASFLWHSTFFMVQLSHLYMTTGKPVALTLWTFASKVMTLIFKTLSKFVIAFLPRSKCLLILWLQSTVCSDFEAKENKVCHCFHCFPIYLPCCDGTRCHDLCFLNIEL